jgi:virginiamycin A acetyltransferase
VEPYTIAVGNPARPVRKRFDDDLIGIMLELKWWDLPINEIQRLIPLLVDDNLTNVKLRFLEYIASRALPK